MGAAETRRAIAAAAAALPAWTARTAKERAVHPAPLVRSHARASGGSRRADDRRTGQAAGRVRGAKSSTPRRFIEWFAEEAKRLYGDVIPGHQADKRILVLRQPVGVVAAITPWNFPRRDDYAQGRARRWRRGCTLVCKPATQTPLFGAGAGGTRLARGHSEGRVQCDHGLRGGDRRRDDRQSHGAQADVHRFHRDRQETDGAVRRHGQEALARTRRQCAVHRLRRCRSGRRGAGRDRQQVSEYRADLRLRQSSVGAGRNLR